MSTISLSKKKCHVKGHWVGVAYFHKNKARPDGLASQCKSCYNAQDRARYAANPAPKLANNKTWWTENWDMAVVYRNRRRTRKIAAFVEDVSREGLRERDGDLCTYCSCELYFGYKGRGEYRPDAAEIEHVIPLARGGIHSYSNCVLSCASCNRQKGVS